MKSAAWQASPDLSPKHLRSLEEAAVALARLDEALAASAEDVAVAWREWALFEEAAAAAQLEGRRVDARRLVLFRNDASVEFNDRDVWRASALHLGHSWAARHVPGRLLTLAGLEGLAARLEGRVVEGARRPGPDVFDEGVLGPWLDEVLAPSPAPALLTAFAAFRAFLAAAPFGDNDAVAARIVAAALLERHGAFRARVLPLAVALRRRSDAWRLATPRSEALPVFLAAIAEAAAWGRALLRRLAAAQRRLDGIVADRRRDAAFAAAASLILRRPAVTAAALRRELSLGRTAATALLRAFAAAGVIHEVSERKRFRVYSLEPLPPRRPLLEDSEDDGRDPWLQRPASEL